MKSNLSSRTRRRATVVLTVALLAACAERGAERPNLSNGVRDIRAVRLDTKRNLREASGAAMSRRQGGVVFMIEDSGNRPTLFALDTTGVERGAWRVLGATNTDWESLATGPCSATKASASAKSVGESGSLASRVITTEDDCVYVGDTGDNNETRPSRAIYKLVEPDANGPADTVRASRLRYVYSDGPHDVEAMYVAKNSDVLLITKRPRANASGQLRPALVFALSTSGSWDEDTPRLAQLVDSLPIIPGAQPLMTITDAALSPDGKHLAVRTYAQAYVFSTDSATGRVNHAVAPSICDVTRLGEPQGEGLTWVNDRGRLAFTSEGKNQPLRLGTCEMR